MRDLEKISIYMSKLLRHKPELGGIVVDTQGYTEVESLLNALNITKDELDYIVSTDSKKRYSYDKTGTKIRANQGHSLPYVKIDFDEYIPKGTLYHGTAKKYIESILKDGLKPQTRNKVHISKDIETAITVGMRHAKIKDNLIILEIDALKMYKDGFKFEISENGAISTFMLLPFAISSNFVIDFLGFLSHFFAINLKASLLVVIPSCLHMYNILSTMSS